jgi:hypothetical protein
MADKMTAEAIERCLSSPNVSDSNGENANVVDVIDHLARRVGAVARAITPTDSLAGEDATGGRVESLTEAVMGLTAGMVQIANAIESLACAVRERAD